MEQQFKPIEDFIFVSPAPCYTAAALSNAYRKMALTEKDRYMHLIEKLILRWTRTYKFMIIYRAKDLLEVGNFCENLAKDLIAIGK